MRWFSSSAVGQVPLFLQEEEVEAAVEHPFEQALCQDVLTLMTVFSARLYGKRSHQNKVKIN